MNFYNTVLFFVRFTESYLLSGLFACPTGMTPYDNVCNFPTPTRRT